MISRVFSICVSHGDHASQQSEFQAVGSLQRYRQRAMMMQEVTLVRFLPVNLSRSSYMVHHVRSPKRHASHVFRYVLRGDRPIFAHRSSCAHSLDVVRCRVERPIDRRITASTGFKLFLPHTAQRSLECRRLVGRFCVQRRTEFTHHHRRRPRRSHDRKINHDFLP